MISKLYSVIDDNLDRTEIEPILLNLEKDFLNYKNANERKDDLTDDLTLIEKINPFSERDKKGDILKIKIEIEDIANVYNEDINIITQKASQAIHSIPAFKFKFQINTLQKSIKDITASGPQGAWVTGKEKAQKKVNILQESLAEQFGSLYSECPTYTKLIKGYLSYLLDPYHLPTKLKS